MKKPIIISTLAFISTLLFSAVFISTESVSAAYSDIPTSLPTNSDPNVYLTVSNGSRTGSGGNLLDASTYWVKLYSNDNTVSDKSIVFDPAYSCSGTIQFQVWEVDSRERRTSARSPVTKNACSTSTIDIPKSAFTKADQYTGHEGMYVALLRITQQGSGQPLTTFKLNSSGMRIGTAGLYNAYYGTDDNFHPGETSGDDEPSSFMQAYLGRPSPGSDGFEFRFKAPCDYFTFNGYGNSEDIYIKWFDDDVGTSYQPDTLRVRVQQYDGGWVDIADRIARDGNGGGVNWGGEGQMGYARVNIDGTGPSTEPKKLRILFSNVSRANGVLLYAPFDSGDYDNDCGADEGWRLDTNTTINFTEKRFTWTDPGAKPTVPPGYDYPHDCTGSGYGPINTTRCNDLNDYYDILAANTTSARTELAKVNLRHYVENAGPNGQDQWVTAKNDTHQTGLWYRYYSYTGTADPYRERLGGALWSADITPGQTRRVWASDPSRSPSSPVLTSSVNPRERRITGAGVGIDTDGYNSGNPHPGDRYCERIYVNPDTKPNDGSEGSSFKCVELTDLPDVPECSPWTLQNYADTIKLSGAGGGDRNGAWVYDGYGYYYAFGKTGGGSPYSNTAERTSTLTFNHYNFTPPATLGFTHTWNASFALPLGQNPGGWGRTITIDPSYGGQYFGSAVNWSANNGWWNNDTNSDAGCPAPGPAGSVFAPNVYVPWYYHMYPRVTVQGSPTMQQGETIDVDGNNTLPDNDDNGNLAAGDNETTDDPRYHTYSQNTNWRIVEFKTSNPSGAIAAVPNNTQGNGGPCADLGARGIPGFSACNGGVAGNAQTFTPGTTNLPRYTRPAQIDPVGTNICFVTAINRPTHHSSAEAGWYEWRYSQPQCKTVVKSPKVQFKNGDISVGRYPLGTGGASPCGPIISTAGIQTTNAPGAVGLAGILPQNHYLYGSWVEYAAFAPGNISSFGSSAEHAGNINAAKRLTFTNENSALLGRYDFASRCLSNFFTNVSSNPGEFTPMPTPTANPSNLNLNTAFPNPAEDRTGYVSNGTDININPPALPNTYTYFTGRDIVIYAKKDEAACSATSAGNLNINTNIEYRKTGYSSIKELPRIILIADCNIIINHGVSVIDASLIAGDSIRTCGAIARNHGVCNIHLKVNGQIQASRLLLWRTGGADLSNPIDAQIPAEAFDMTPDQILAGYTRGSTQAAPKPAYQLNLPPRY